MHETLLNSLISNNSPVTIILDEAIDTSLRHNILVYFLTIEDFTPMLYYYKLIESYTNQSASGLFDALKTFFSNEKRDLTTYLKYNLIEYISDGAPVMIGKNGLI